MKKRAEKIKRRIGLTGKPRIGKSTVIKAVITRLKAERIPVGGMLTADIQQNGLRVGFSVEDINTGERGIMAHVLLHQKGPKIGKYVVNLSELDTIGANSIRTAVAQPDPIVIIVDEIGPMELKSKKFISAVEEAMESNKPMLVSVHLRSQHELVKRVRREFDMIVVTEENRDAMADSLANKLLV